MNNLKRIIIIIFIGFIPFANYGQGWEVKTVIHDSIEYFYFPKHQNKKHVMFPFDLKWVWKKFKNGNYSTSKFPKDGMWIQFFKSDSLKVARKFEIKDSTLNGKYELYYFNQNLKESSLMKEGIKIGTLNEFYENGQKESEIEYSNTKTTYGYKVSSSIKWYENGTIKSISEYDKESGSYYWKSYYENGQIQYIKKTVDGEIDGNYIKYAENGNILFNRKYKKGKLLDTISTFYYDNKQIESQGKFVQETPISYWEFYFQNGNLKSKGSYTAYNTTLCSSAIPQDFTLSTKDGKWTFFYENGNIRCEGNYKLITQETSRGNIKVNIESGKWKYFYSNGTLMAEGEYSKYPNDIKLNKRKPDEKISSKKVGKWKYYKENGKLTNVNKEKGQIQSIIEKQKKEINRINASS